MSTAAANDPTTALWETLRDFIVQAFTLFGAPHEIAQFGVRLREEHKLFLHYLRQCETLLRKLLFIEALALTPPLAHSLAKGRRRAKPAGGDRPRRFHTQEPENSESWRVTFRLSGCSPLGPGEGQGPGDRQAVRSQAWTLAFARDEHTANAVARFTSTWPAAERFEALLRAFNDPAPYVKRLARLIRRKAQLIRVFAHVPARAYGKTVLEEEIRDATRLIRERRREPDSS